MFMKGDLVWLCRLLSKPEKLVRDFYIATAFSSNLPVTLENWKPNYHLVRDNALFSWVPHVLEGLKAENMNLEVENEGKGYERRLTV